MKITSTDKTIKEFNKIWNESGDTNTTEAPKEFIDFISQALTQREEEAEKRGFVRGVEAQQDIYEKEWKLRQKDEAKLPSREDEIRKEIEGMKKTTVAVGGYVHVKNTGYNQALDDILLRLSQGGVK